MARRFRLSDRTQLRIMAVFAAIWFAAGAYTGGATALFGLSDLIAPNGWTVVEGTVIETPVARVVRPNSATRRASVCLVTVGATVNGREVVATVADDSANFCGLTGDPWPLAYNPDDPAQVMAPAPSLVRSKRLAGAFLFALFTAAGAGSVWAIRNRPDLILENTRRRSVRRAGGTITAQAVASPWGRRLLAGQQGDPELMLPVLVQLCDDPKMLRKVWRWTKARPLWAQVSPDGGRTGATGSLAAALVRNPALPGGVLHDLATTLMAADPDTLALPDGGHRPGVAQAIRWTLRVAGNHPNLETRTVRAMLDPARPADAIRDAVNAVAEQDPASWVDALIALTDHVDVTIHSAVVFILGPHHDLHDRPDVQAVFEAATSPAVPGLVRRQVPGKVRCECVDALLPRLLDDPSEDVRVEVARHPRLSEEHRDLLTTDPAAKVRRTAHEWDTTRDVAALVGDGDRYVRALAVKEHLDELSDEQLVALADDRSLVVRREVAQAPRRLPVEAVDALLTRMMLKGADAPTLDALHGRDELTEEQAAAVWVLRP